MKALYVGSFKPFTIGHMNIVNRVLPLCDELVVASAINPDKPESKEDPIYFWNLQQLFNDNPKVTVDKITGLTVDYCNNHNIDVIVRGIRNVKDFTEEQDLANINKEIGGIETIFLMTDPKYNFISSSFVRAMMKAGKDVSKYLP